METFFAVLTIAKAPEYHGITVDHILTYNRILGENAFEDVQQTIQCVLALDQEYQAYLVEMKKRREWEERNNHIIRQQRAQEQTAAKPYDHLNAPIRPPTRNYG